MTQDDGDNPRNQRERRVRSTRIGRQLRQMYDEVVQEDVPDEFLDLLDKADEKRSSGKGS